MNRFLPLVPLFLMFAALACSPGWAGTPYLQAVGAPPVCTSLAWRSWYVKLLHYRLAECPVSRAATFYFSDAGNDITGDGSQGNPWKSIAKAQKVLDASSGNVALLFKRGDVWQETATYTLPILSGATPGSAAVTVSPTVTSSFPVIGQTVTLNGGSAETLPIQSYGLVNGVETFHFSRGMANAGHTAVQLTLFSGLYLAQPNVTIGAWGDGTRKPIFSAFADRFPASRFAGAATRGDGYTRTWSQVDANTVGWVREVGDVINVYRRLASVAQVDATPGSWYQDLTTHIVYVHAPDDLILNTAGRDFEAVPVNNAIAVFVSDVDGTRLDGIRIDGYGCAYNNTLDPSSARAYGIKGTVEGAHACVVSNCETYFDHNHGIGVLGNFSGGLITYFQCKAGWDTAPDAPFVSYHPHGGQETIVHECECPGVVAPSGLQPMGYSPFPYQTYVPPYTEHTGSVTIRYYKPGRPFLSVRAPSGTEPFTPGMSLMLTGGTPETLTVQSYDAVSGTLTFNANIVNSGHTAFAYASGPLSGALVTCTSALSILYGCRNQPGPYQSLAPFGAPLSPPQWTDLADCRAWNVGEQFSVRTPGALDVNSLISVLTPSAQTSSAVTLTSPNPSLAVPQPGAFVTLTGGPAPSERIQIAGYSNGMVTFATTIAGVGRTEIQYAVGPNASDIQANFSPFGQPFYSAIINGRFEGAETYVSPNAGDSQGFPCPSATNVYLNCTFVDDWSQVSSPNSLRLRTVLFFVFCRVCFERLLLPVSLARRRPGHSRPDLRSHEIRDAFGSESRRLPFFGGLRAGRDSPRRGK